MSTSLTDGDGQDASAITDPSGAQADRTFSFFYDQDVAPVAPTAQTQTVTVTATSGSLYSPTQPRETSTATFVLSFVNPCIDPNLTTITPKTQTDPSSDDYSGATRTFTYDPFTVDPPICPLTISCVSISPDSDQLTCDPLDGNNQVIKTYTAAQYQAGLAPGSYTFNYSVTTGAGGALT